METVQSHCADKLSLVSLLTLQETWEPDDERLRCCHVIPEFICVASMSTVFKSTRSGSKSCHWCCQDTQAFLSVGIYLSYCIVSPNQSAFFCSCNPPHAFNAKPLLSEIVIPMAHWCYFYVPAESIDELWQHPVHKGTNISFTGLYEIKLL